MVRQSKPVTGLIIQANDMLAVAALHVGGVAWLVRSEKPRGKKDGETVLMLDVAPAGTKT